MFTDLLSPIDELLRETLPAPLRVQSANRVQQIFDPTARRPVLMAVNNELNRPYRFTLDTKNYDIQLGHRLVGGQPVKGQAQWGSRVEVSFDLFWVLIGATKRPDLLTNILLGFSHLSSIDVTDFSTDTLNLLKNEFLFSPDQKTPYDPELSCFAVRYRMLNVSETVFSSLYPALAAL